RDQRHQRPQGPDVRLHPRRGRQLGRHRPDPGAGMSTSTLAYPDLDTLTPELRAAVTSRASLNIFRMITHSPGLAPSFLTMASDVLQYNSLPATWRELLILRVGYRYGAGYEVHHHLNIGRAVGLTEVAIAAAESGATDGLEAWEAAMVRLTDLLLDNHT